MNEELPEDIYSQVEMLSERGNVKTDAGPVALACRVSVARLNRRVFSAAVERGIRFCRHPEKCPNPPSCRLEAADRPPRWRVPNRRSTRRRCTARPQPQAQWDAAMWLHASIGDALRTKGDVAAALANEHCFPSKGILNEARMRR